ncbi:hypothetical protein [Alloprevotella tannerae]|uniref:hypothetical protein n=1 Tax=Alloprevotella tannerae TaxID=76122 RepID=UPI002889BFC9|nr:hypothetical protein [Alloprevotella tannerae]
MSRWLRTPYDKAEQKDRHYIRYWMKPILSLLFLSTLMLTSCSRDKMEPQIRHIDSIIQTQPDGRTEKAQPSPPKPSPFD